MKETAFPCEVDAGRYFALEFERLFRIPRTTFHALTPDFIRLRIFPSLFQGTACRQA